MTQADPEIENLMKELNKLLPGAKIYPFSPLFPEAKHHDCHRNVDAFVAQNDAYRIIRGWLLFDFRNAFLLGMTPTIRLRRIRWWRTKRGRGLI
jgi:hypothetical protein